MVQSIDRAFAVLRALVPGAAGVPQLAEQVGLPKSTVSRLLSTLEELGAVEQVEAGGDYRIGATMAELAAGTTPSRALIAAARPRLVEVGLTIGEAVGVSVPDGTDMLYLDQVNPDTELQVRDWTGTRIPMHAVPSGQVVLAHRSPAELDAYLATPMARFTDHTLVQADELRSRLRQVAEQGWAWAIEEYADGLSSVAAPIRDHTGRVVAALHVYGPAYRFPGERSPDALGAEVADAATKIRVD